MGWFLNVLIRTCDINWVGAGSTYSFAVCSGTKSNFACTRKGRRGKRDSVNRWIKLNFKRRHTYVVPDVPDQTRPHLDKGRIALRWCTYILAVDFLYLVLASFKLG